jgi:hypothetical protein
VIDGVRSHLEGVHFDCHFLALSTHAPLFISQSLCVLSTVWRGESSTKSIFPANYLQIAINVVNCMGYKRDNLQVIPNCG